MTALDPATLTPRQLTQHLAALADAVPDEEHAGDHNRDDEPTCRAWGPYGECCRDAGHLDGAFHGIDIHVTFERDHYDEWPVGWRSPEMRVSTVLDPLFGSGVLDGTAQVSDQFRAGFKAALDLVRGVLAPPERA